MAKSLRLKVWCIDRTVEEPKAAEVGELHYGEPEAGMNAAWSWLMNAATAELNRRWLEGEAEYEAWLHFDYPRKAVHAMGDDPEVVLFTFKLEEF